MDMEQTLLSAIAADPGDDAAWLALADCLEEQGQADRAELMRLREWLRKAGLDDPQRAEKETRLQDLLISGVKPSAPLRTVSIAKGVSLDLALIPPGCFWMGSPSNEQQRFRDEGPRHRVRLKKGFWLGVYPITREQWRAVFGRTRKIEKKDHPVAHVSWQECVEMCAKLSELVGQRFRLATEAEWEYACRAGTTTTFYTGNDVAHLEHAGWYQKNSGDETHPVGLKVPNAWGLYDMHGNILEWCLDGCRRFRRGGTTDPNHEEGKRPATRGGAFTSTPQACRAAFRYDRDPEDEDRITGCRVVQPLE